MKACEPSLMALDAEVGQRIKGDLRASVATDAPEPVLQLVAQDGAVLVHRRAHARDPLRQQGRDHVPGSGRQARQVQPPDDPQLPVPAGARAPLQRVRCSSPRPTSGIRCTSRSTATSTATACAPCCASSNTTGRTRPPTRRQGLCAGHGGGAGHVGQETEVTRRRPPCGPSKAGRNPTSGLWHSGGAPWLSTAGVGRLDLCHAIGWRADARIR